MKHGKEKQGTATVAELFDANRPLAIAEAALGRAPRLADGEPEITKSAGAGLAVVPIFGPLAQRAEASWFGFVLGYDAITDMVTGALADDAVSAVALVFDSPGGDVAGCFECVRRLQEAKAASGKPIVAFVDEQCASAAYALACVADVIVIPPTGDVGSVGVLAVYTEVSRALDTAGVTSTVFRSPARKNEASGLEPLTTAGSKRIQAEIEGFAAMFVDLVASARGMSPAAVKALDGLTFIGADAVAKGLADSIGSLEDAVHLALEAVKDGGSMNRNFARAIEAGAARSASNEKAPVAFEPGVAEAVANGVAAGRLTAAEAWEGGDPSRGPLASAWAGKQLEEVRAHVGARAGSTPTRPVAMARASTTHRDIPVSEDEAHVIKLMGVSRKDYASAKAGARGIELAKPSKDGPKAWEMELERLTPADRAMAKAHGMTLKAFAKARVEENAELRARGYAPRSAS